MPDVIKTIAKRYLIGPVTLISYLENPAVEETSDNPAPDCITPVFGFGLYFYGSSILCRHSVRGRFREKGCACPSGRGIYGHYVKVEGNGDYTEPA